MSAIIRIDQATQSNGENDTSRDGVKNQLVTLRSMGAGTSHSFELLAVPNDDTTAISSFTGTSATTATFMPSGTGSYRVLLTVDGVRSIRIFAIRTAQGVRIPAPNEKSDPSVVLGSETDPAKIAASEYNAGGNAYGWSPTLREISEALAASGAGDATSIKGFPIVGDPTDGDAMLFDEDEEAFVFGPAGGGGGSGDATSIKGFPIVGDPTDGDSLLFNETNEEFVFGSSSGGGGSTLVWKWGGNIADFGIVRIGGTVDNANISASTNDVGDPVLVFATGATNSGNFGTISVPVVTPDLVLPKVGEKYAYELRFRVCGAESPGNYLTVGPSWLANRETASQGVHRCCAITPRSETMSHTATAWTWYGTNWGTQSSARWVSIDYPEGGISVFRSRIEATHDEDEIEFVCEHFASVPGTPSRVAQSGLAHNARASDYNGISDFRTAAEGQTLDTCGLFFYVPLEANDSTDRKIWIDQIEVHRIEG